MTRIAGVPPELRALSSAFAGAAPELRLTVSRLSGLSLPETPPGVGESVTATLSSVGSRLQSAALTVERAGIDAGNSAAWLEIAGAGGLLVTFGRSPFAPIPGFTMPTTTDLDPPELPEIPPEGFTPAPEERPGEIYTPPPELPRLPDYVPSPGCGGIELIPPSIPFPNILNSGDGGDKPPPIVIEVPPGRWPDADQTIRQGEEDGNPAIGAVDREGAAERRRERLGGIPPVEGKDRDEWPPAVLKPDGDGATVRPADPHDNRGMGSHIGGRLRGVPNGSRVHFKLGEPEA